MIVTLESVILCKEVRGEEMRWIGIWNPWDEERR